jgi:hypothetical protein
MPPLNEWNTLLAVQAGAAATLTGLVFVAVSINLAKIVAYPGLPSRAAEQQKPRCRLGTPLFQALTPGRPSAP